MSGFGLVPPFLEKLEILCPSDERSQARFERNLTMPPVRLDEARMDSLHPFLYGSFIPYNMPVYPGAFPDKSSC